MDFVEFVSQDHHLKDLLFRVFKDVEAETRIANYDQSDSDSLFNHNMLILDQLELLLHKFPASLEEGRKVIPSPLLKSKSNPNGYDIDAVLRDIRVSALNIRSKQMDSIYGHTEQDYAESKDERSERDYMTLLINACSACLDANAQLKDLAGVDSVEDVTPKVNQYTLTVEIDGENNEEDLEDIVRLMNRDINLSGVKILSLKP